MSPGLFVNNLGGSSISQFNLSASGALSPKTPPTVGTGSAPNGMAVSPDGRNVYVANTSDDSVSQYDVGPGGTLAAKAPATVATGDAPIGVAVSADGKSAYVTNLLGGSLSQYDRGAGGALSPKATATVAAGTQPEYVVTHPAGHSVYATNFGSGNVSQYDVGAGGALSPKATPTVAAGTGALGLTLSLNGASLYVTNGQADNVSQYDVGAGGALTPKTPSTVSSGGDPAAVAVAPDGSAYVTNFDDDNVSQYNASPSGALSPKSTPTVSSGDEPLGAAVSADGRSAYVANSNADTLSQYDVGPGGLLAPKATPTVATGDSPEEIRLLPEPSVSYSLPTLPLSPSCLRREISLVRADVRRRRVVLRGLVQPRFVGQPIRILANYRGAKAGALTRLATVRSDAAGQFKATVRRPARKTFNKARFRAQVDRFRSAPLKLPQSLSSSSIKQVGGQLVLRGKVKRSLLGRRNRVTIKRLVCGRYRTVARVRPGRNGRYVARFSVPANVAVALFRAETRVLRRRGGRRYVKQYARAISITLTNSTG